MRNLILSLLILLSIQVMSSQNFISVKNQQFQLESKPYYFIGTNFWYGMNLGSKGEGGDRERLLKELDLLDSLGIKNLRIMAASEGPDSEPWRMLPALQTAPGVYNEELLVGLDYLLMEMKKRGMHAVLCFNNMWPWSGGFAQYMNWFTGDKIPYPPPAEGGKWLRFMQFSARFFKHEEANEAYQNHIRKIVTRRNSITGELYKNDPTIMAWQLANEPRPIFGKRHYLRWIRKTAAFIKELDQNHLVSIGSEGNAFVPFSNKFRKEHKIKDIDYSTGHIWIQNWGWYNPEKPEKDFEKALARAKKYVQKHIQDAQKLGKPFVLEEFGIARDMGSHDANSSTSYRDRYYREMFQLIYDLAKEGKVSAGANFWSWGGFGRPREPHAIWKKGDSFIGDPPFEYQGWYSVYDRDTSTLNVLKDFASKMKELKID